MVTFQQAIHSSKPQKSLESGNISSFGKPLAFLTSAEYNILLIIQIIQISISTQLISAGTSKIAVIEFLQDQDELAISHLI